MTPTPEDIALADEINAAFWSSATPMTEELQARLIAAHTAPLRELAEIGRLAVAAERIMRTYRASRGRLGLSYDPQAPVEEAINAYLAKHPTEKP